MDIALLIAKGRRHPAPGVVRRDAEKIATLQVGRHAAPGQDIEIEVSPEFGRCLADEFGTAFLGRGEGAIREALGKYWGSSH
jgi:hypothetical protein